ncbi:unnamed protein product [Rotaria sp. Silwood1]|nr:unnamed protein product [Rotaria sp. Silwood1]CAF4911491.1 unnamed protein product [Rotaria sp. Silwood1]CAF4982035.1 unnamed protein product [Rotaria sp. Silwood1]CAF5026693.1 unnamed protein product [Rotaria sp. Silwood1]
MSTIQQDLIYEEFEIKQRIQQHNDNEKNRTPSSTVKRHPTNHSQLNDDQYTVEYQDDDMEFQEINYNRQRKKRINKDKDQRIHARMIINSNINNNRNSQATTTTNDNIIKGDSVRISKHALDYASEYHHQPFKIECDPKLKDQREGSKFIQAIINYIKIDFYKQNVSYNKQLLFDLWWIDKEGNIRAIVKYTEIAVYLSQIKKEYNAMLNSVKISIFGQLYDIDEFLPSPKLLICSKYNQPGHVKNSSAVYVPPKNLPPFELFQAHDNENIIIFGDFNAKHQEWDCEKNNLSVNRIKEWIENEGWHILYPSKPTSKKSKSIIDFAIGQDINGWNAETLDEAFLAALWDRCSEYKYVKNFRTPWPPYLVMLAKNNIFLQEKNNYLQKQKDNELKDMKINNNVWSYVKNTFRPYSPSFKGLTTSNGIIKNNQEIVNL